MNGGIKNMETRFLTKLFGQHGQGRTVVAYGLNKFFCSNCTRPLNDKEYVYTCEEKYGDIHLDQELRVLNCDRCERNKQTACVNFRYDSVRHNHIHALAILRVCPHAVEVTDFIKEIIE